jgi:hypothetical protein
MRQRDLRKTDPKKLKVHVGWGQKKGRAQGQEKNHQK